MNKVAFIVVVIVILIIGAAVYFVYQRGASTPSNTGNFTTNTSGQPTQPTQPQNLNALVSIKNFAFNPTPLTIKSGTAVTWTNNDSVPHQIKSATFNSAVLSNGQTFSFTFSTAGQYSYSCAIHPYMHGQIIVTQ